MSSRSLVGVGRQAEETLCPRLGKCDGSRRESEVVVEPGKPSGLLPVAVSSDISRIVHLEAIGSYDERLYSHAR
jgi:hypothetical protein